MMLEAREQLASLHARLARCDPKAVTAAAHKLAQPIYTALTKGEEYTDQGRDYYEERYRQGGFGFWFMDVLCGLQQKLDLHGFKRKDNPAILCATKHTGV